MIIWLTVPLDWGGGRWHYGQDVHNLPLLSWNLQLNAGKSQWADNDTNNKIVICSMAEKHKDVLRTYPRKPNLVQEEIGSMANSGQGTLS